MKYLTSVRLTLLKIISGTSTEGLVTNLHHYNDAVADKEEAEKALFFRKATCKPELVAEVDVAKDLLREGAELEQRRIKLIQEINNQRQLIAYWLVPVVMPVDGNVRVDQWHSNHAV